MARVDCGEAWIFMRGVDQLWNLGVAHVLGH